MTNTMTHARTREPVEKGKWEKLISRMDLIIIIATILYYVRVANTLGAELISGAGFDYAQFMRTLAVNTGLLGIALLVFSLITFIAIIYFAVKKRMNQQLGLGKATAIIIWNLLWIVGDLYLLSMALFSMFS